MANNAGRKSSDRKQNWRTPKEFFANLSAEFPFVIDLAADENNHLCDFYFDEDDNALDIDWWAWYDARVDSGELKEGMWAFLNPPFANLYKWYAKCYEEQQKGMKIVMLAPANTDPKYFHDFILGDKCPAKVAFSNGRVQYYDPDRPNKKNCGFGTMVIIWEKHDKKSPDFVSISKEGKFDAQVDKEAD